MFAIVAVQVLPSLADVLSPSPNPSPTASALPEVSDVASPAPTTSPSPSVTPVPEPSASITYLHTSVSESPTPEPTLADNQDVVLRLPTRFPVDPRATSVKISPFSVASKETVLVCIASTAHIQLTNTSSTVLISGNNTTHLLLSGDGSDITTVLNSGNGLRISASPRVQGSVITTRAMAVTRETLNSELCGEAPQVVTSAVIALGLGMNTVKNPVPIK